jgi:Tfp pilus assembly protein PilV
MTRSARGTTLIEAMIATTLFAVGLVGITGALAQSGTLDRRQSAAAAAHAIGVDLAKAMETWPWADPCLQPGTYTYSGTYGSSTADAAFANPKVTGFSVTGTTSKTVTDTFDSTPQYSDTAVGCTAAFKGRTMTSMAGGTVGQTYLFNRYWNVMADARDPNLRLIAIHVTYAAAATKRGVVTVYTSVFNTAAIGSLNGMLAIP